jgi:hypothetical protein
VTAAEDRAAYAEEVKTAQEEAAAALAEPPSADILQSEWDLMLLRRGQGDANLLFDIVAEHGAPNIVPDPEPEEEAPAEESAEE